MVSLNVLSAGWCAPAGGVRRKTGTPKLLTTTRACTATCTATPACQGSAPAAAGRQAAAGSSAGCARAGWPAAGRGWAAQNRPDAGEEMERHRYGWMIDATLVERTRPGRYKETWHPVCCQLQRSIIGCGSLPRRAAAGSSRWAGEELRAPPGQTAPAGAAPGRSLQAGWWRRSQSRRPGRSLRPSGTEGWTPLRQGRRRGVEGRHQGQQGGYHRKTGGALRGGRRQPAVAPSATYTCWCA